MRPDFETTIERLICGECSNCGERLRDKLGPNPHITEPGTDDTDPVFSCRYRSWAAAESANFQSNGGLQQSLDALGRVLGDGR